MSTELKALKRSVEIVGGQTALARKIGGDVKQSHVWNWLNRDKRAPAEYIFKIERATNGAVRARQLRPDVFFNNVARFSKEKQ